MDMFKFAVATDITDFAKENFSEMYEIYEKIYITPDVNDYHILRILKDHNKDYEVCEGSFLLEEQRIPKSKTETISSLMKLSKILEEDDGGNWDYGVFGSLEECIDRIDGGFGILEL